VEPFLGSGAVFFDLLALDAFRAGASGWRREPDLIGCYQTLRDDVEA
jgi:site-specific DNA-adenine methylase